MGDSLSNLRLFQLISPSLPTGSFTYSQGLEWVIDYGWVVDQNSLVAWLVSILHNSFRELELPLLQRLYNAAEQKKLDQFKHWADYTVAVRETNELRLEEINRGRAMSKLLLQLDLEIAHDWLEVTNYCQVAGFALAAVNWNIDLQDTALGYTWGWLENMVMAAVKVIPLGQTSGQKALAILSEKAQFIVDEGLQVKDEEIGGSSPAFAIASCMHEKQYTRLFRS